VGGGQFNTASGYVATVSGGWDGTASERYAVVGGGLGNTASEDAATVSGGFINTASGSTATVGGGQFNTASGWAATVGGGQLNTATGSHATVAGGGGMFLDDANSAIGSFSAIGGGSRNTASGYMAMVGGGGANNATGSYATVPGGTGDYAVGDYSFAGGYRGRANHIGSFVWGSSSSSTDSTASFASYSFAARCAGGARFYTAQTGTATGVGLSAGGGAWSNLCDVRQKRLHGEVNTSDVLSKVAQLPLHRWSYKTQEESIQHIGPTAQDFYAAFRVGESDTTINTLDPDGIALTAIQELAKKVAELEDVKARLAALEARLQTSPATQMTEANHASDRILVERLIGKGDTR
jgi:hypothetical protein